MKPLSGLTHPSKNLQLLHKIDYNIVDEIDSILIDEARTPLIISGFSERIDDDYRKAQEFFKTLNGITIVEVENDVQTKLDTLLDSMEDPYQKYKDSILIIAHLRSAVPICFHLLSDIIVKLNSDNCCHH